MTAAAPIVWCLLGRKAGDNTQLRALADELAWAYCEKPVRARNWQLLPQLLCGATLAGIDRAAAGLTPPWPDLVFSAGRRCEPVARWIKRAAAGRTRLVHLGRPWAPLHEYDLIITTPQYFLPAQQRVLHNQLPLTRILPQQLQGASAQWAHRLAHLPRPWLVLLLGGDSGKFVFTEAKGRRLGQAVAELARRAGGSVLWTDSPRTPPAAAAAVQEQLRTPGFSYRWAGGGANPYLGMLALADAFVVTGESMSLLAEAAAMDKPLYIFDMGDGARAWWRSAHRYRLKPLSHQLLMALAPQRLRRDVGKMQQALIAGGRARWLPPPGQQSLALHDTDWPALADQSVRPPADTELARSAARVRQLLTRR